MSLAVFDIKNFVAQAPAEFAIIEHPDQSLEICLGPFEGSASFRPTCKNLFFSDFSLTAENKFYVPSKSFNITTSERLSFKEILSLEETSLNWSEVNQQEFEKTFNLLFDAIKTKNLIKAVPICFIESKLPNFEALLPKLLCRVIKGQPGLYSYAFRTKDFLMIGASPEILFNLDSKNKIIISEAVAGSILGPSAPIRKLTDKLLEEQQLVVQDLSEQLAAFGEVEVSEVKLKNLSSLCHLKSDINVKLSQPASAGQIINALHPSGALGLLPRKNMGHQFIKALDQTDSRVSFGAPFGIIDTDGSAQIIVAIRNIIIQGSTAKIAAGVGITAKSEFAAELQEVKAKQSAVINFFGI